MRWSCRLLEDGDVKGGAARDGSGESEGPVRGDCETVAEVILQYETDADQALYRTRNVVSRGRAGNLNRHIGRRRSAATRDRTRLCGIGGLSQDCDLVCRTLGDICRKSERSAFADGQILRAIILQDEARTGKTGHAAAYGVSNRRSTGGGYGSRS